MTAVNNSHKTHHINSTMNKLFGSDDATLLKGDGTITVSELKKNAVVGIYFSAHWCPPCRAFTPALVKFYKNMQATGRSFELVFASSDRSESDFTEYFGEMPWAAFPLNDARIRAASSKFKVQGIPTLVLLDGATGKLLQDKGRAKVMGDPQGADFPWPKKTLGEIMAPLSFTLKGGKSASWSELSKNDAVGLYFSAHWCGPCRAFTPQLIKTYNKIKADGKKFEIVFVSSDRDSGGFDEYYGDMPWAALPFAKRSEKEALSDHFGVEGIPSFIIIDPKTNKIITDSGRSKVMADKDGAEFPWHPKPLEELGAGPDVNSTAILTLLTDNAPVEEAKAAVEALRAVATAKKAEWGGKSEDDDDEDFPLDFGYGDEDCGLVGPIRGFCAITKKAPVLFILDVPNRKKFMWEGTGFPTAADIEGMVSAYIGKTLPGIGIKDPVA